MTITYSCWIPHGIAKSIENDYLWYQKISLELDSLKMQLFFRHTLKQMIYSYRENGCGLNSEMLLIFKET